MNTIDVLELRIKQLITILPSDSGFHSGVATAREVKALTEAIQSLKCDKLARVREYVDGQFIQSSAHYDREGANYCSAIENVKDFIDQLDKEQ